MLNVLTVTLTWNETPKLTDHKMDNFRFSMRFDEASFVEDMCLGIEICLMACLKGAFREKLD